MPGEITTATSEVTARSAEIAAEAAYIAKQSADDDAVAVADPETPPKAETPAKVEPPVAAAPVEKTADEKAAFAKTYKDEFPDATEEEISAAMEEEGEPATTEEEEDDEDFEPLPEKKETDDEFTSALEKHGVKIKLDDITDPVAKKFITTRLSELEAGFTKAMQEARQYRKDEVTLKADVRFQKEHPVDHIVSLLLETPNLGEQVNEKLTEMESPTARKAHDVVVRDAKAQAKTAEETESNTRSQRIERGEQVEQYAIRAAERAGVPYELGIAESIVALVLSRGENGDVTKAEVDQIIKDKASVYVRRVRAFKRESRKAYIAQKAQDAKTGGLKVKPGAGVAPGVGKKAVPKSDDEFVASFEG